MFIAADEPLTVTEVELTLPVPVKDGPPRDTAEYDLCIVIPLHLNRKTYKYELIDTEVHGMMERIIQAVGRNFIYMYDSFYGSLRFVLIHGNNSRLRGKAESLRAKLLLDKNIAETIARQGDKNAHINPVQIVHRPEVTTIEPFEYIYGRYVMDKNIEKLYTRIGDQTGDIFSRSLRIQLLMSILQDKPSKGGADVNLARMYNEARITGYYPLHCSKAEREKMGHVILSTLRPWMYPLEDIRNYFGEKIAMFAAFSVHYVSYAIIPALLGIGCQIALIWDEKAYSSAGFGLVISIWVVVVFEFWKRKERYLGLYWGTLGETDAELMANKERASFRGVEIQSYIDGSTMEYYPPSSKSTWGIFTGFVILCLVAISACAVGAIYLARALIFESYAGDVSQAGASLVNALVITILSFIAKFIARWLCELENHRTDATFEESFITKLFGFSFINCYASFYYLAFGARYLTARLGVDGEGKSTYDADYSTAINLVAIFIVRYIILGFANTTLPWIFHWMSKFWRSKKKCRATFTCLRWFFLSAVKKFVCRYICFRIDLAYDEDTYDSYTFNDTATDKVESARNLKAQRMNSKNAQDRADVVSDEDGSLKALEEEIRRRANKYTPAEKEYRMGAYDVNGLATRYLEQIIILGYMTFFVCVLPASFPLGVITILTEVRGELWMMLHRFQRSIPQRVESIGLWKDIIELMILIAVGTNAAIVIFTLDTFDSYTDFQRMGIFVLFQYCVFILQYIVKALVPDNPIEVTIQRQRQDFITSKLIEKQGDLEVDPLAML